METKNRFLSPLKHSVPKNTSRKPSLVKSGSVQIDINVVAEKNAFLTLNNINFQKMKKITQFFMIF